jgi:hypothetical protein
MIFRKFTSASRLLLFQIVRTNFKRIDLQVHLCETGVRAIFYRPFDDAFLDELFASKRFTALKLFHERIRPRSGLEIKNARKIKF